MLSLYDQPTRLCDGINRRELLRIGGLGCLGASGLSLTDVLQADASNKNRTDTTFGRAKNVIFLWLQGGPPQHETWDPKPDAPAEIRGEFQPIATNVPGIRFSELLPRTAAMADKIAVVRSMHTNSDIHSVSGYHVLTGYRYRGVNARRIDQPNDWPYFGSIVRMLKPSATMPAYTTVWLPNIMRLNENVTPAGQTAGFIGRRWDPERIIWDPSDPHSQMQRYTLPDDVPPLRLRRRQHLLQQVDNHFRRIESGGVLDTYDQQVRDAFSILGSGRARLAFDIGREPQRLRDRYGRTKWGQCVLLARRLIEAGVRLVHVNWTREAGDSAVDNPMWDTHALNSDRLQDALCPLFDIGFTALIEDLSQRGLLDETLVVAIGEFGRTPRINRIAGRDHWGNVFSFAMAGAGIRSAQVYGASDRIGGYPAESPVTPGDFTATLFHLLGISPHATFPDRANRPSHVTQGTPIHRIIGNEPATTERCESEGNVALVPPFSDEKLFNIDFDDAAPLIDAATPSRLKGWRASPISGGNGFGVQIQRRQNQKIAVLGFQNAAASSLQIRQGDKALLAQEIRLARAGHYRFSIRACGTSTSQDEFAELFARNFTCRLILFRYAERSKDPRRRQDLASLTFAPTFRTNNRLQFETVTLSRSLDSSRPGSNFAIGLGLGVAVQIEKTSPGVLRLERRQCEGLLCIDSVELIFGGRRINEDVDV